MPNYEQTDVYYLETQDEVAVFCDQLQRIKRIAPASLKLTIAVTASRDVTFRPQGTSVPENPVMLDEVDSALKKCSSKSTLTVKHKRKSKRSLDPARRGY